MSTLATRPTTASEGDEGPHQPGKYLYPEFAGWAGEWYAKKLLRQILPMALYRTWEIFVEHQANGNACYLGISQLAAIAGRTLRTMQKNLAELKARHLLIERAERKVFCGTDGRTISRAVVVKDFSNLYALAHEYHEWLNAADYIAPAREFCALIAQDAHLVARLRRFDNYRRVLYHQLPGPSPKACEEDRWFTEYRAGEISTEHAAGGAPLAPRSRQARMAKKQVSKELANQLTKDSPKRIIATREKNPSKEDSCDSGMPFSATSWKQGGETPARPVSIAPTREQTAHEHQVCWADLDGAGPHGLSSSPSTLAMQHDEQYHQHDEAEAEQKEQLVTVGQGGLPPSHQASEQGSSSPDHPLIRSFLQEIFGPFGDANPKGSLTRVRSLLASAGLSQPTEVVPCLVRAYIVARDTRTIRADHCDARTGRANRMPLFCTMVERLVRSRVQKQKWDYTWHQMEKDIAADERLRLWWSEQRTQYRDLVPQVEAQEEAPSLQGDSPHEPASQKARHRMSAVLAQQRQPRLSQTEEEREARARYARTVMARVLSMGCALNGPSIGFEHLACGYPLYHTRAGTRVCARCFPDPAWPEEVHALIHSIGEASPDGGTSEEDEQPFERHFPGAGQHRRRIPAPGTWAERGEAHAWGVRVLETLASSGYIAEMVVRPLKEHYQVVLLDEGCELILETAEQAQFLMEQASAAALKAREHAPGIVSRGGEE